MKTKLRLDVNDDIGVSEMQYDQFLEATGSCGVQQNYTWLITYIESYLNRKMNFKFYKLTEDSGDIVSIFSMQAQGIRKGRFKLRQLCPLGWGPSDFFDIPVIKGQERAVCEALVEYWCKHRRQWDRIILSNIPAPNIKAELLEQLFVKRGFFVKSMVEKCFYTVDVTQPWEKYYNEFLVPNNKDLFKDLRKIERLGIQLTLERHKRDIYANLEKVLDIYAKRRTSLGQKNTYETEQRRNFVMRITAAYERSGNVELSFLKDNDENIWAFQLDWLWQGVRYHWNHAYNEDFKKYSPGKILLLKVMEASFSDPSIIQCNHMRGAAEYKSKLANVFTPYIDMEIVNPYSVRYKLIEFWNLLSRIKKNGVRFAGNNAS